MALALSSVWRARRVNGLSLYPGTCRQTGRFGLRKLDGRRQYAFAPDGEPGPDSTGLERQWQGGGDGDERAKRVLEGGNSRERRRLFGEIARRASPLDTASVMLPPVSQYADKRLQRENGRKRMKAAGQQAIYKFTVEARGRDPTQWVDVLDMLRKHSAPVTNFYEFQVLVGGGLSNSAVMSRSNFNVWDIQERTNCVIRVDDVNPADGAMTLSVSGHEESVRRALGEVTKAVGKLKAIRLTDPDGNELFLDSWLRGRNERLPGPSAPTSGLTSGTLGLNPPPAPREDSPAWKAIEKPARYYHYMLVHRVDQIPLPSPLTSKSFEAYIASLVHATVPSHLHDRLYGGGLSHNFVVANMLFQAFSEIDDWTIVTRRALEMALRFTQGMGPSFRFKSRSILERANHGKVYVPVDTSTFNVFLRGYAASLDLDGFIRILKSMIKRGLRPNEGSWLAFLRLTQQIRARRQVVRAMRAHRLDRMQSTLAEIGASVAPFDLDPKHMQDMGEFVAFQDHVYGPGWLAKKTPLNRMLTELSKHQRSDLCRQLLDLVYASGRAEATEVSMNTLITNLASWEKKIEFMKLVRKRWTHIVPHEITYHILFQAAWKTRAINILRVIWHYATFSQKTTSKLRDRLSVFMHKNEADLPKRLRFVKRWQSVIFGEGALLACREKYGPRMSATSLARYNAALATVYQPRVPLDKKLKEAYFLDKAIFQRLREDQERLKAHGVDESFQTSRDDEVMTDEIMTEAERRSLTVQLPLKLRDFNPLSFPLLAPLPGYEEQARAEAR